MSISCIKNTVLFFFTFFFCGMLFAQNNFIGFWEPEISLNSKVSESYSLNFSVRKRSFYYNNERLTLNVRNIDIGHFSTFNLQPHHTASFGLMYRERGQIDGGSNELRLTQQYNINHRLRIVRFGHRLRAEQRITQNPLIHRFRYRFAVDFPLEGEKTDPGEAYLVTSTESLLSVAKASKPELDQRFTVQIGWLFKGDVRLQAGAEYRVEDFGQRPQHVLFLLQSLIFSL